MSKCSYSVILCTSMFELMDTQVTMERENLFELARSEFWIRIVRSIFKQTNVDCYGEKESVRIKRIFQSLDIQVIGI